MISIISVSWQMYLIMRHPFDSYVCLLCSVWSLFSVGFFFCQWKRRRLPVAYDTNVPSGRLKLIPSIRCLSLRYQLKRQNRVLNKQFFVGYSRVQSCARKRNPAACDWKCYFKKRRRQIDSIRNGSLRFEQDEETFRMLDRPMCSQQREELRFIWKANCSGEKSGTGKI